MVEGNLMSSSLERPATRLKRLFAARRAAILPGTPNALFARMIAAHGFEAVYVTGAGIANMSLGVPDIGLVTLTELVDHVAAIADAVDIPILADADTGFGNPINTARTVRLLQRAGAAGIQIEDQVFPKKCGHFVGKQVIPAGEMVQKIKAAVDARRDGDLQIVARTDARAIEGLEAAIARAQAYVEAGADVTFVEAPLDAAEMQRIARETTVPQIANMVFGGLTPPLRQTELAALGFGGVLYANAALQAAIKAVSNVMQALRRDGSLDAVADQLAGFAERQRMVGKAHYDELEQRYQSARRDAT
jgi:2-methylisocitrate lyase-like PEP mutase family enzyme